MITNEMKIECDKRKEEIAADEKFQQWISDIRCCVNMYKNVQDDRIRLSNQSKKTKTGENQKIPENQKWKISDEQIKFNNETIEYRKQIEQSVKTRLEALVKNDDYPIYNNFLKYITGLGGVSSAILLCTFRLENIYYVSNMYAYAGIVTGKDKLIKGQKSTFDTYLKSKLLGVIGTNFIKLKSEYALYYYQKRIHLINRDIQLIAQGKMSEKIGENEEGKLKRPSAAHHSRMAIRHMIQMFVRDYYVGYRTIMGIPVVPSYAEDVLNLNHVGENFVNFDIIQSWASETKDDRAERRQNTLRKIEESRKTLQELMIKYDYKELEC